MLGIAKGPQSSQPFRSQKCEGFKRVDHAQLKNSAGPWPLRRFPRKMSHTSFSVTVVLSLDSDQGSWYDTGLSLYSTHAMDDRGCTLDIQLL